MGNYRRGDQNANSRTDVESDSDADAIQKAMEGQTESAEKTYRGMLVVGILLFVRVMDENRFFKYVENQEAGHQRDQHRGWRASRRRRGSLKGLRHNIKETDAEQHPAVKLSM